MTSIVKEPSVSRNYNLLTKITYFAHLSTLPPFDIFHDKIVCTLMNRDMKSFGPGISVTIYDQVSEIEKWYERT